MFCPAVPFSNHDSFSLLYKEINCPFFAIILKARHRNFLYRWFMTGGINPADPHNPLDNKEHVGMVFFRDSVGKWLHIPLIKTVVLVLFVVYIGGACWGITNIQEGLEKRNTANYDSYSVTFYDLEDKYFKVKREKSILAQFFENKLGIIYIQLFGRIK